MTACDARPGERIAAPVGNTRAMMQPRGAVPGMALEAFRDKQRESWVGFGRIAPFTMPAAARALRRLASARAEYLASIEPLFDGNEARHDFLMTRAVKA